MTDVLLCSTFFVCLFKEIRLIMSSSAIKPYPIEPIATMSVDKSLANALLASVAEYREWLNGRRIWLACSGGRDSLALAALCLQLYQQGKLPFLPQLLHIDHGLQAHSHAWAQHVAHWARVQGIPCIVLKVNVQGNDEQAARQARYQAMLSYMNQEDVLLLAHHADDQAETVLMRLIQGAGVNGLSAMQPWREQSQSGRLNVLWRPWLTVRRNAITAYAERLQLPYIDDPTNDSGDNVRSGLRCEIMPALTAYNTNAINNIARSAQLLADAQATVSAQAEVDMQQTSIHSLCYPPIQRVLNIDQLHHLPAYRQRQLLHYWLAQDEPLPPAKQLIDDVLSVTQRQDNNHQTQLYWQARKQQYSIRRYRQQLYRLSHFLLNWLKLPLVEHKQKLTSPNYSEDKTVTITLRHDKHCTWQLQLSSNATALILDYLKQLSVLSSNKEISDEELIFLKVTPLGRQQSLQTLLASRPQSGKKLTQTLGIPVWLRESLVVVSAVVSDNELPLFLLSPFNSWVLGVDIKHDVLNGAISNILKVDD